MNRYLLSGLTGLTGTAAPAAAAPDFLSDYQDLCDARLRRLLELQRLHRERRKLDRQIDTATRELVDIEMRVDHLRATHPNLKAAPSFISPMMLLRRQAE